MRIKPVHKLNLHAGELRPYRIPPGMVIIQDTREWQYPLFPKTICKSIYGLNVINLTLRAGDYTIQGFEPVFTIERKRISDFYTYIGAEQDKTVVKMEIFADMIDRGGFVGLAIEATEEDIYSGYIYSQVSPEKARQAINSFRIRYGVHVYFNPDRDCIRRFVLDSAIKFYKVMREV